MNREQANAFIQSTHRFGSKLGLENIKALLNAMGNPQKDLKFIHIAGTNGKGSVASYLHHIFMEAGFKSGIYTTPYMELPEERIRIGHQLIPESDLVAGIELIQKQTEALLKKGFAHPTEFEVVTALALWYFAKQKVDVVVLEVGLGGRFDATNVIEKPLLSLITSISMDHMEVLGDSLSKIAYEKAGIIKEGVPVLSYFQQEAVKEVLLQVAKEKNADIRFLEERHLQKAEDGLWGTKFSWRKAHFQTGLIGKHQQNNALLAIEAIYTLNRTGHFDIPTKKIKKGIRKTTWPGRLEVLHESPYVILDGAHNEEGTVALIYALEDYFPKQKKIFVVGMLADKDIQTLEDLYGAHADEIYVCEPDSERALKREVLYEDLKKKAKKVHLCNTNEEAIDKAISRADKDAVVVMAGSLYLIGNMRPYLREKFGIPYDYQI